MARVLGVIRLSREREESTSPERQRDLVGQWAQLHGHEVVGWAEDIDVSGSVAPWKRPGFGQWLPSTVGHETNRSEESAAWDQSRAREWDIACSWKLDRISRSTLHTWQLHEWCKANGKQLASVADGYDLTTPVGEFLFGILASFAQMELETMRYRAKESFNELMRQGRWRGGWLPYGYRAVPADDGAGHRLVVDDDPEGMNTAAILRDMIDRVLGGQSINSVCAMLNDQEVPSPLDTQRIRNGKEAKGASWRVGNVSTLLASHTLLGWAEVGEMVTGEDGKRRRVTRLVRGDDGQPVLRAEPIIDRATFERLRAVLAERKNPVLAAANRANRSMLLGVAHCSCGTRMYTVTGRNHAYYRCGNKAIAGKYCEAGGKSHRRDRLDDLVTDAFLGEVGEVEVIRRTYVPGEDFAAEIADTNRALDDLEADRRAGLYESGQSLERFRSQHRALSARLEELTLSPVVPGRWVETPTGETYRERWESLATDEERNAELIAAGVHVVVLPDEFSSAEEMFAGVVMGEPEGDEAPTVEYWRLRRGRVELRFPPELEERVRRLGGSRRA
ncbi:recombinase family protein [Isoptericola sp. QY 916]|uniref:recombinase family protein n=1 Tax=Isoptericola sp. QY 916 TaxID=2782570 RepID=UPI003D2FCE27|nr:recombinase family protein [Isoptericola sp. QY 916]